MTTLHMPQTGDKHVPMTMREFRRVVDVHLQRMRDAETHELAYLAGPKPKPADADERRLRARTRIDVLDEIARVLDTLALFATNKPEESQPCPSPPTSTDNGSSTTSAACGSPPEPPRSTP